MRVKEQVAKPVTQNLVGIAASQAVAGAGPLTLTATPVDMSGNGNGNPGGPNYSAPNNGQPGAGYKWNGPTDGGSRVIITSAGNDSGITFKITGTDFANNVQSETVTGGNATGVTSTLDYRTVTSIVASGAVASTVEAGWGTEYITPWIQIGNFRGHEQSVLNVFLDAAATANFALEATNCPLNRPDKCYTGKFTDNLITLASAQTAALVYTLVDPFAYVRVRVNSLTGGNLTFRVLPSRTV